ncbi:MAG: SDR family NAD(P)-dependent oxidoreductase [Actinobacteria bacterium]|nr:SDR family NAD(P)-dependent oxidoreductase [Actinomycetota bacterium]
MLAGKQAQENQAIREKASARGAAIVTGASEGIGYELCKLFAKDGYDVVLVARNERKLRQISEELTRDYGVLAHVVPKDLSNSNAAEEIYNELEEAGVEVTALASNAGFTVYGYFAELEFYDIDRMLQVMVWSPIRLTSLFLKGMVEKNRGKVLFVGSAAATDMPGPFFSIYNSCKACQFLFAKAIATELIGTGVSITMLNPGYTRTQFAARASLGETKIEKLSGMDADEVALLGYEGMKKGKMHVVPGNFNKFFVQSNKITPYGIQSWTSRKIAGSANDGDISEHLKIGSTEESSGMKTGHKGSALITGASEGIGRELSKLFAEDGYDLVLVARNEDKLDRLSEELSGKYKISAKVIVKDLSQKAAPQEIYDEIKNSGIEVTALVNNAGYNVYSPFTEADFDEVSRMLQVMIWTPTQLTHLIVSDMLEKNRGKIMNVGSIVAHAPSPCSAVYSACKAFLLLFSKALSIELTDTNVSMTLLSPGNTRTQFASRSNMEDTLIVRLWGMSAEDVARAGYEGMMAGKVKVVPGMVNKMLMAAGIFSPWFIQSRAARILASKGRRWQGRI